MVSPLNTEAMVEVIPGAEQLAAYIPLLEGKSCGLLVNQSSLVGSRHLVDTLQDLSVRINRIFVPEHGFRGKEDAGKKIDDQTTDSGIPIVSLYGARKKPTLEQLAGIDVVIYDLQDVGVRCYTYLTTLHYLMEACAEQGVKLIVLDRPNPNGHYVDGPVLKPGFESMVGKHPIPFVYGMTIGECAQMIKGESWINEAESLQLEVVPCWGYDHMTRYPLPVRPSPNLPTYKSVLLYPSLVFFEGTVVSAGRGTDQPFEHYGHPNWSSLSYSFTPGSVEGARQPKFAGETCFGEDLRDIDESKIREWRCVNLSFLIESYNRHRPQDDFFLANGFIDKLAGSTQLREAIEAGMTESEIRENWRKDLETFSKVREKYLIYP